MRCGACSAQFEKAIERYLIARHRLERELGVSVPDRLAEAVRDALARHRIIARSGT
jgi:hypothetical protein